MLKAVLKIEAAVKYCIGNNILKGFLKNHGSEVMDMSFLEYNYDDHMAAVREEEREEIARNALAEGSSIEYIQKITGLDLETIKLLSQEELL